MNNYIDIILKWIKRTIILPIIILTLALLRSILGLYLVEDFYTWNCIRKQCYSERKYYCPPKEILYKCSKIEEFFSKEIIRLSIFISKNVFIYWFVLYLWIYYFNSRKK